MDLTVLGEMAVGAAARGLLTHGIRVFLARNPGVVEQAIAETCDQFEIEGTELALARWATTAAFESFCERLRAGERDFGAEVVESFIKDGDFWSPDDDELTQTAERIVSAFLNALLGLLLRSDNAIPTLANRQEQLHSETQRVIADHMDEGLAQLKADVLAELGRVTTVALDESPDGETPADPEHAKLAAQLDSARDLTNAGSVASARKLLQLVSESAEGLPHDLEFRLFTYLGACSLALEDIEEGCAYLEDAHRLRPDDPAAIANAALAARLKGEHPQAVELASRALHLKPRDSQAAAALIEALWDAGDTTRLDELVGTEEWLIGDRQCAVVLARVWTDQHRFDEALELSQPLIERDGTDYDARLVVAGCLLAMAQAGQGDDPTASCREAVEQATEALRLLAPTELRPRRLHALSIRAGARLLLGRSEEAAADIDAVMREIPDDPSTLYNKGLVLIETDQFREASAAFSRIEDGDMRAKALLPLAFSHFASGGIEAAVELLRGEFSLERPSWDDIRKAELLCEAERSLGSQDSVGPLLEDARSREPDNPKFLALAARHHEVWGEPADTSPLLREALDAAGDDYIEVAWRLANLYARQERFSDAADLYIEVVGDEPSHPAATSLLSSLGSSGRLREALAWARKIRQQHPHPPRFALESEAKILGRVGDVPAAVDRWLEVCSRNDATTPDQVSLAHALFRGGDRKRARDTARRIDTSELVGEPQTLVRLAQLKQILGEPDYLEDGYLARRYGLDDSSVHLGYVALFFGKDKEMTAPDVVGPGCAVLLQQDSEPQWWLLLDPGEEPRGPNDLELGADLAQALVGRRRGDTVTLQEGIGELSYEIADIQNKYVRAFQETTSSFPTRFPGNTDLSSVPVTEDDITMFLRVVDERDRFVSQLHELYRHGPIPFAFLCARIGRPAPELWRACTESDDLRIRFSSGSEREAELGQELLPAAGCIALDMLALLTVHKLKLADHLRRRFDRVVVPQGVIDELRSLVIETSVGARPSGHVGRNIDGTYFLVETSEDAWNQHQEFARSVLSLAESFEAIASYPELDVGRDGIEELSDLVTDAGVSAIFAGGEDSGDRPLLVTDDLGLANLARGLGAGAVNTQAVLRELRREGELTDEQYASLVAQLAMLNYQFVQVEAADILRLLEANGFATDEGSWALLATLEGPECSPESALAVVADLIAALAQRGLPVQQESLLISLLLGHLHRGRRLTNVLRECVNELEPRLALAPSVHARIRALVVQYIEIVGG